MEKQNTAMVDTLIAKINENLEQLQSTLNDGQFIIAINEENNKLKIAVLNNL